MSSDIPPKQSPRIPLLTFQGFLREVLVYFSNDFARNSTTIYFQIFHQFLHVLLKEIYQRYIYKNFSNDSSNVFFFRNSINFVSCIEPLYRDFTKNSSRDSTGNSPENLPKIAPAITSGNPQGSHQNSHQEVLYDFSRNSSKEFLQEVPQELFHEISSKISLKIP